MVAFPPCKINLGLNILHKRPDGYHDIATCFYPIPWTDILEIIPSDKLAFTCSGNSIPGNANDNLCLKAYRLLNNDFNIPPVKIHLHKIIPMGAGLGGGSSDAAFTLKMLNEIYALRLSEDKLHHYAAQLGSDCAFFLQSKPMLGYGRGEILTEVEVDLQGKFMVIVKPDVHVATAEAYAGVQPKVPVVELHHIVEGHGFNTWRDLLTNDFESSVFKKYPVIKDIKDSLYVLGAVYASMSGSGSAVFGVFEKQVDVNQAFEKISHWSGAL